MAKEIRVSSWLALRLSDWHASMYDPVYAVSSSGLAKRPVPRDIFEAALANMEASAEDPEHESRSSAAEISAEMRSILGTVEPEEVFDTVALSLSRTLWVLAWSDEAEEQGESLSGQQLMHSAPDTPEKCLVRSKELLNKIIAENKITIDELLKHFENELDNGYDLGHELALSMTGSGELDFGGEGSPWIPLLGFDYYDFADEWKSDQ